MRRRFSDRHPFLAWLKRKHDEMPSYTVAEALAIWIVTLIGIIVVYWMFPWQG